MARRIGVSTSYLNLIEHDQRPLTRKLIGKISEVFDIELDAFSESEDSRLAADLREVLADPLFSGRTVTPAEIGDAVAAAPSVGRGLLDVYRAYGNVRAKLEDLGEELRNREMLATVNFEFRTLLTSIRSFAEILRDNPQLDTDQRQNFLGIIVEDSKRLLPLVGGLLNLDPSGTSATPRDGRIPADDVASFVQGHAGYFAELEAAAADIRGAVDPPSTATAERLADSLLRDLGIAVEIMGESAVGRRPVRWDPERRRLEISEVLSDPTRRFEIVKCAALMRRRDAIDRCLDAATLDAPESRELVVSILAEYLAAAVLMPYEPFHAAARDLRHDIERLQRRFGVGFEQVCRRLTTLQRPGERGVPFHFVRIDMAGNVTSRFSVSGLRIARFGGLCSLWNLHAAFLSPGTTRSQLSRMPDGTAYFSIARTVRADRPEIARSPRFSAIELGCEVSFARDIVYADGLDLGDASLAVPIGPTCRLCERVGCAQRVAPPFHTTAPDREA